MQSSPIESRWLALILFLGLVLRAAYLLEVSQAPDFDLPRFEAQYHDYWARALVSGDWSVPEGVTDPEIQRRPYFRPPGYPFFLATVYRVFGDSYWTPRLAQMVLGLASCVLVWWLARRPFGVTAALWSAAILASYWVLLFFEAELMAPVLIVFLLLAILALAGRWVERPSVVEAFVAGLLLGLLALVRPNALLLPAVLVGWMIWLASRQRRSFWRPVVALSGAVALVLLPSAWRNWRVAQDLVLVTSNAGINLFVGNHPESDGYTPGVSELVDITGMELWESFDHPRIARAVERRTGRSMRDSEISDYFVERLRQRLDAGAAHLPGLWLRKTALFWGPAEVSNNKVLEIERKHSRVLRVSIGFSTLLGLAVFGLVLSWRRGAEGATTGRRETTVLLLASLGVLFGSYLPFFVASRFRLVVVPILVIFAGVALAWLGDHLAARRWRSLALSLAALVALCLFLAVPWVAFDADESLWHFRRALLHRDRGELPAALMEAENAVAADSQVADRQLLLAELLAGESRLEQAEVAYLRALELRPESADASAGLATVLARQGKLAAAIDRWRGVLRQQPERLPVLNNLALALATAEDPELRDPVAAVELAERADRLASGRIPALRRTLALAYRAAGREADAAAVLASLAAGQ